MYAQQCSVHACMHENTCANMCLLIISSRWVGRYSTQRRVSCSEETSRLFGRHETSYMQVMSWSRLLNSDDVGLKLMSWGTPSINTAYSQAPQSIPVQSSTLPVKTIRSPSSRGSCLAIRLIFQITQPYNHHSLSKQGTSRESGARSLSISPCYRECMDSSLISCP